MALFAAAAAAALLLMEPWAAILHRVLWHGPLWRLHRPHHAASAAPGLDGNDLLSAAHAPVSIALIAAGLLRGDLRHGGGGALLGAGIGMALYGALYVVVHDGVAHGRFGPRLARLRTRPVFRALTDVHLAHHAGRGGPFGFFLSPLLHRGGGGATKALVLALVVACAGPALAAAPPTPPTPALEPGTYALDLVVVGKRDVPILGDTVAVTRTLALVKVTRDPAGLVAEETACAIVTDGGMYLGRASPALLRGLPPARWRLDVDGDRLSADLGRYRVGFAGGDALPHKKSDAGVTDPDGDGRPGARMDVDVLGVGVLHLQVVSRWDTTLRGRVVGDGVARGMVRARSAEHILSGLPFPGALGPLRPEDDASTFELVRVERETTCAALAARQEQRGR